ncbi:hypothetical protein [Lentibacillus amyloliquefaciens]|uniref:Uncharacterized protein n=1 Tax=Lentibacillus amyloliquefaciens TaxID=1472767 RepID=A0A0U4G4T2_9BACI|nr:hypothetical protein [Lentibacillus amyloliquefaciens]ALX47674.1 hypothetical protein AOX59_03080 [Lentibacillus amyloliquefaciens]
MNKELEQEVERVRKQMKKGYLVFLAILLLGIGSLAYNFMKGSYAFEIVFFFSFIAAMVIIRYLPIITLPARFSKVINSILIVLGFIIIGLIFSTIWTNITFPFEEIPDTIDPDTIGILNQFGIQIKYAVLTSTSLFLTVILLNKKSVWTSPMLLAILGLAILLLPFVLLCVIKFYGLLKGL